MSPQELLALGYRAQRSSYPTLVAETGTRLRHEVRRLYQQATGKHVCFVLYQGAVVSASDEKETDYAAYLQAWTRAIAHYEALREAGRRTVEETMQEEAEALVMGDVPAPKSEASPVDGADRKYRIACEIAGFYRLTSGTGRAA